MVKVYFETTKDGSTSDGKYAELVAIFSCESAYDICRRFLEKYASENDMIVTESVEEDDIDDLKIEDENI